MAVQPWGEVAADTKLDLMVDPAGFLAGAASAYSADFTLGQLQNQAYGYLFPHGLFFLLTDFLPDWVAQRLWWTLVVGVGYSGFLVLLRRIDIGSPAFRFLAAALFAFSPRTLTTLTAISSETWPVMLSPWVVAAVLSPRLDRRALVGAIVPVALMGAVNASATLLACLPAGIALLVRVLAARGRGAGFAGLWLLGCALVSAWWIGPLLVLGRYSAPFTDFIESSFVTNRWLNLAEILRGTTSWAPFVDTERTAGALLVLQPVYVLVTMAVAAAGLVGLCLLPRRSLWLVMLFTGVALLGAAHGPFAAGWLELLDGPLAAFRNIHKADPLVRIPLLIGLAHLGSRLSLPTTAADLAHPSRRHAGAVLVSLVALAAVSPALSARLLPTGTWNEIPDYWLEATAFLNDNAAGTRTLIAPETPFARQDWGWTRDEPAQPLLDVPWAVRDAIPLVDPEAVRGLDGMMAVLHQLPEQAGPALVQAGIGAVLVRHDLENAEPVDAEALAESVPGARVHGFGEIEVVLLDPDAGAHTSDTAPLRVAGGGESVALVDTLTGPAPRELVATDADVVTDTPLAVARNYGTLENPVSAPLARPEEGADVRNRVRDYPSAGPLTRVVEHGLRVSASSSAADATAFGGADVAKSVTAGVDKHPDTAWWPAPGAASGEWIELAGDFAGQEHVRITATDDSEVTVSSGEAATTVALTGGEEAEVVVPGPATGAIRVTLAGPAAVGIAEISVDGHPAERVVTVPDTSPNVRQFLFQRLMVDTGVLVRDFTAPRDMTVRLDSDGPVLIDGQEHHPGDTLELPAGQHRLDTEATWVTLTEPGFAPATGENLYYSGLSANEGLRAHAGGVELEPRRVGAGMQGFVLPEGVEGPVEVSFAGERAYRGSLIMGGALLALTLLACAVVGLSGRRGRERGELPEGNPTATIIAGLAALFVVAGPAGLIAAAAVAAIRYFTLIRGPWLAAGLVAVAGAWLARSPWPSPTYAGDVDVLQWVLAAALACSLPGLLPRTNRASGSSMNS